MGVISERLALVIDAQTGGAASAIRELSKSSDTAALSEERRAVAELKATAGTNVATTSAAKLSLELARQSGDADAVAAAEGRLAEARAASKVSTLEAKAASDSLMASELQAKAAALGVADAQKAAAANAGGFKGALTNLTSSMSSAEVGAVAVAGALEFKVLSGGISKLEALGHETLIVQGTLGGTAQQASLLIGQFKQLSIDPDTAAKSVQRMGAAIYEGSSKLEKYGIEVAKNRDGTNDLYGTLDNLRTAYNNSADATERDAIAKQLGLRNAQALIPYLKLTNDEVKALNDQTARSGGVLTQADVDRAHQLSIASQQLRQTWDNIEIGLAKSFVPALTQAEGTLATILPLALKVDEAFGALKDLPGGIAGAALEPIAAPISAIVSKFDELTGARESDTQAAKDQAAQEQRVADATAASGASADAATTSVDKLTTALQGEAAAQKTLRDSLGSILDAQAAEATAQAKLTDLIARGPVDTAAVADATDKLKTASESVTRAQDSEARAQLSLNAARKQATAIDLADAQSKIVLAGDKITSAKAAEEQAKEKLDALLGSGTASAGDIASAQADLKTKTDDVTQSVIDQGLATQTLTTLRQKGTDADPAVAAAELSVADARQSVADALTNQAAAQAKLQAVETPSEAQFNLDLAAANRAVSDAHNKVSDAQDAQANAALSLKTKTDALATSLHDEASAIADIRTELDNLKAEGYPVDQILSLLPAATGTTGALKPGGNVVTSGPGSNQPDGQSNAFPGGPSAPGALPVPLPGHGGARLTSAQAPVVVQHFNGYSDTQIAAAAAREGSWSLRTTILPRLPVPA